MLNDASTDNTHEKIQKYLSDKRVNYIEKKVNEGLAKGLNEILQRSTADFIARHDADDIMLPGRIELQRTILSQNPDIDILSGGASFEKENSIVDVCLALNDSEVKTTLFKRNPIIHPTVMLRRKSIVNIGGYDEKFRRAQDYELWLRAACANLKFKQDKAIILKYSYKEKNIRNKFHEIQALIKITEKYKTYQMLLQSVIYLVFRRIK